MPSSPYIAVNTGNTITAAHVNQFLTLHPTTLVRTGKAAVAGATAAGSITSYAGAVIWIDQPFTIPASGVTTLSRVGMNIGKTGTGVDVTVSIYADAAGVPTGAALFSILVPLEFLDTYTSSALLSVPLNNLAVTASTKYHLLWSATASTASNYINVGTGIPVGSNLLYSNTSATGPWTTGSTSTAIIFYTGATGMVQNYYIDSGARWVAVDYTKNRPNRIREYTTGSLRSSRTINMGASSGQVSI